MLTRKDSNNRLIENNSEVKIEHLLEFIKIEIENVASSTAKAGWNNSTILVTLIPILVLFQGELQKHWEAPVTFLDNWLIIFLCSSLLFDSFTIFTGFEFIRFTPPDIRFKYQWSNLFNRKINSVDLMRYGILIAIIFHTNFQAVLSIESLVVIAYILILLFEIAKRTLNHFTLLLPYQRTKNFEQFIYFFIAFLFFISSTFYFEYLQYNFDSISAKDIYTGGLICIIFYLLRLINPGKKADYIKSLEDIRKDLCLGDIKSEEAKRRITMVTDGMSLPEAVADLIETVLILLNKMKMEVHTASQLLSLAWDEVRGLPDTASLEKVTINALKLQREQGNSYKQFSSALNKYLQSSTYKWNSGLLRKYKKANMYSFSQQTVIELKTVKNKLDLVIKECENEIDSYEQIRDSFSQELNSKSIQLNIDPILIDKNLPEAKNIFPIKEFF